jgi:Poxvirus D5 protein-like
MADDERDNPGFLVPPPLTETLMAKPSSGIPNDVARLKGARFVSASETEFGRRLAESLVKELTGNDTVSARFMRGEWFDFRPTHKTWLGTNHKPEIRGTDPAIWDRIRLVPFEVRIPDEEIDRELPEKLRAELPGILAWAVEGCLAWQRGGLQEPRLVRAATNEYRVGQDVIAAFIDECCVVRGGVWAKFADLYGAYADWCDESNEKPEKKRAFGDLLSERGFAPARGGKNVSIRNGIALLTDGDPPGSDGNPGRSEGYPTNGSNSGTTGSNKHPTQDGGETEGNRVPQGVTHDNPQNPSKSQENKRRVTQGYPEIGISESKPSHKDLTGKHGNLGNPEPESGARRQPLVGPAGNGRLTPEEVERHKRLVREGMKPDIARAEVLAKRGEGGVA